MARLRSSTMSARALHEKVVASNTKDESLGGLR